MATPSGWPDLTGDTRHQQEQRRCWLELVWSDARFADAVELASPQLARHVSLVITGQETTVRRARRTVLSVVRYVLRAQGRATPFGLFAGVAPVRLGAAFSVRKREERVRVRPDARWLGDVVQRLEALPELAARIPVMANAQCRAEAGRVTVPWRQNPDGGEPVLGTVRHTTAVDVAMRAARSPIVLGDLARRVVEAFPGAAAGAVHSMLTGLLWQRILLSALHPPMTATDPLGHILAILDQADVAGVEEAGVLLRELREIHGDLSRHSRAPELEQRTARQRAAAQMSRLTGTDQPLMADLRLGYEMVLPEQVAREAERAAWALTRLSPNVAGNPVWWDYHARYLLRYGSGVAVPLTEITGENGLGLPARFRDSRIELPGPTHTRRDRLLLAMAQRAAIEGSGEVVLDAPAIEALAGGPAPERVQPHAEIAFHLHAPTAGHLDRGDFTLTITGAPRAAGTTVGRFLDLLEPTDRQRMTAVYAGLPTLEPGALPVQVSAAPLYRRVENVSRAPAVLPHVLPLAEPPTTDTETIALDDLAVQGDANGLWLVRVSDGRRIEPRILNAVEFRRTAQPLTRFLCEITNAGTPTYTGFDWGAAGRLPFLPRLRYGRTVLAPARWQLPATELPDRRADWLQWEKATRDWLNRFRVPQVVHLTERDLRIRLDLREAAHLVLLREYLSHDDLAELSEAPADEDNNWLGRIHEITLTLAADRPVPTPAVVRPSTRPRVADRNEEHLPGASPWLYAKLYAHPARHDHLLIRQVPELLAGWADTPQWWYLRYCDPEPHLRLRLRLPDPDAAVLAVRRLGIWAKDLRDAELISHLQLDTYRPETGRYGADEAMTAAEAVFAADSRAAIAQARHAAEHGLAPAAVTAASIIDLGAGFLGSATAGNAWLLSTATPTRARPLPRDALRQAQQLADPARTLLRSTSSGREVARSWQARAAALTRYATLLTADPSPTTGAVLSDLLHLHHLRTHGVDPDGERLALRLARAGALSRTRRVEGASE
ncbi:lantibiotic dehydratase [Kitasatospora nipponensis]|uniref:lantibiotic dehydratase n=1 Tax=Kitasatospora nipponensis TaxID=258049 RepID=UPI0031CFC13B